MNCHAASCGKLDSKEVKGEAPKRKILNFPEYVATNKSAAEYQNGTSLYGTKGQIYK